MSFLECGAKKGEKSMLTRRKAVTSVLGALVALTDSYHVCAQAVLNTVLDVKPFAQTKNTDCWLAAAVMLLRWKNGIDISELDAAKMAGPNYVIAFNNEQTLLGPEVADFANALGLTTEAPQNYTPKGYHDLLKVNGPLWVGARLDVSTANPRKHVRVLRGVTGDGTFDGSTAWILDPDGGRDYQESMTDFAKELEAIARQDLDAGDDLSPQIIRFP
jgi:hypothetical protein